MSAADSPSPADAASTPLPFTGPWLLAPMEGVTEPCFRDLVLERNDPSRLGGAFTEFVRVVDGPVARRRLRQHLGARRFRAPVGLQLMGAHLDALAETARRAAEVGAPLVDLNFGCPAKGALRGCAGAALLDDPAQVERIVARCAAAAGATPVTAKIRSGGDDDSRLEEVCRAAEAGGARLLTVHCRTRAEGYRHCADWSRIRRAVESVEIPVCGNGGIERHADLARMLEQTGCRYAMVGRAALGDPWIFTGRRVRTAEAAAFLWQYAESLGAAYRARPRARAARVKQLLQHWTAGGLVEGCRQEWLRERDPVRFLRRLAAAAGRHREAV